jgi:hypothetical protein
MQCPVSLGCVMSELFVQRLQFHKPTSALCTCCLSVSPAITKQSKAPASYKPILVIRWQHFRTPLAYILLVAQPSGHLSTHLVTNIQLQLP